MRMIYRVHKVYVAVVKTIIKIFPYHDDVLRDLAALNSDPALRVSWSSSSVRELAIRFSLVADGHRDALVDEFQDYPLTPDDELPLYSADSGVDTFWAEMAKKTFSGGIRFPHLAHFTTTLSVIAHSNANSERVFATCRKIDTDPRSRLSNDTLHAKSKWMIGAMLKSAKSATRNHVKDHQ